MTNDLRQRILNTRLVLYAVEKGWASFPEPGAYQHQQELSLAEHREKTRVFQARLRAEQRGLDTSGFPPRIRRKKGDA